MNAPYKKNEYHPENLKYKTRSGVRVRSKSELLITMVLSKYRIPYRYGCALWVGDEYIYPDFTLLQQYNLNGIIPSIHLITTYETEKHPIDEEVIEAIVKYYFL